MSISSLIKVRLENEIIDVDRQTKLQMGGRGEKKGEEFKFLCKSVWVVWDGVNLIGTSPVDNISPLDPQ